MTTLLRPSVVPQCLRCLRPNVSEDISIWMTPFHRQLRGKKKTAKQPSTIKVKLRRDIRGYGRSGSIIPVAPGRMRNIWYPRQMAEYMTQTQLQDVPGILAERDFTFGVEQPEHIQQEQKEELINVQMKLLTPSRATEILAASLPPEIAFYRTPISSSETQSSTPAVNPTIVRTPDITATMRPSAKADLVPIYGSVTTADISDSIRAILAIEDEGKRVVLGPEDVTIIRERSTEDGMEPGRIKALGTFAVEVRVKGGDPIRRNVRVKAQAANEQP